MKNISFAIVFATVAVATVNAQNSKYGTCEAQPYVFDPANTGVLAAVRNPNCPDAAKKTLPAVSTDPNAKPPVIRTAGCKPGAKDTLGLCAASKDSDTRVPVVVGQAQGMEKVQEYYNGYFYGRHVYVPVQSRYQYYDTYGDMGTALQRVVSNKMFDLGYGPKAPRTGAMSQDLRTINAEISNRQATQHPEIEADLIVVTAYGFLNNGTSATTVDGCKMARTADNSTRNVGKGKVLGTMRDIVVEAGCTVGSVSVSKRTEAVLFVGIYKPDGQMIRRFQATDSFAWGEYREVGVLGVGRIDQNSPTLQLLAKRLVDKAFASLASVESASATGPDEAPPRLRRR